MQNWWTHLWLKEGFASWIEYLCVDHCFPEYDIWTQFVSYDLGNALKLDALDSSHPIEVRLIFFAASGFFCFMFKWVLLFMFKERNTQWKRNMKM